MIPVEKRIQLTQQHLNIPAAVASRYQVFHDREDLISMGNYLLIRLWANFDPARNPTGEAGFGPHAVRWIKQLFRNVIWPCGEKERMERNIVPFSVVTGSRTRLDVTTDPYDDISDVDDTEYNKYLLQSLRRKIGYRSWRLIFLYDGQGYSYRAIARLLRSSFRTVRRNHLQAKARAKKILERVEARITR